MTFIEELKWRGMIHTMSPGLEEELAKPETMPIAYIGYDATAPSLTIGNYVTMMLLLLFQKHGGKPIALIGGATSRIGDPSFKDEERKLLDVSIIDQNLANFNVQLRNCLDFDESKPNGAIMIDNYDIYRKMNALSFLRDVGKNITINYMMAKDSVKSRIEKGLSFTEFSYQLLQGYDFAYIYKKHKCILQMGGSDQWGNITSGTHFIGKMYGHEAKAYALTTPLLTKSDGKKFGKSEEGNIWLDGKMTSPYKFYQFWFNQDDNDIKRYNRVFTLKSVEVTEKLEAEHQLNPGSRILQRSLAEEFTERIHGSEGLIKAIATSKFFFSKTISPVDLESISEEIFETISNEIPCFFVDETVVQDGVNIMDLLCVTTSIFDSKTNVRKAINSMAISINKTKVTLLNYTVSINDVIKNKFIIIEHGKNKFMIKIRQRVLNDNTIK